MYVWIVVVLDVKHKLFKDKFALKLKYEYMIDYVFSLV